MRMKREITNGAKEAVQAALADTTPALCLEKHVRIRIVADGGLKAGNSFMAIVNFTDPDCVQRNRVLTGVVIDDGNRLRFQMLPTHTSPRLRIISTSTPPAA